MTKQTKLPKYLNLTHRVDYNHYQTEGKLQNLYELLEHIDAESIALNLENTHIDPPTLSAQELSHRLQRIASVVTGLKGRGFYTHLIVPSPLKLKPSTPHQRYFTQLYEQLVDIKVHCLWFDFSIIAPEYHTITPDKLDHYLQDFFKQIELGLPRRKKGLILPSRTAAPQISLHLDQHIETFSSKPILSQTLPFTTDHDRHRILHDMTALSIFHAYHNRFIHLNPGSKTPRIFTSITNHAASPYQKSAEATQIQTNLSLLFGIENIFYHIFDAAGTAPAQENPFLTIQNQRTRFLKKLLKKMDACTQCLSAMKIILPDRHAITAEYGLWAQWLWRLGIPNTMVAASDIKPTKTNRNSAYVLLEPTAAELSETQLTYLFRQGVLLNPAAAKYLSQHHNSLIDVTVKPAPQDTYGEYFSDASFAPSCYAHLAVFPQLPIDMTLHQIIPNNRQNNKLQAKTITTLVAHSTIPNIPGTLCLDNIEKNQRCVILPCQLNTDLPAGLLTEPRHHFITDVCQWLNRSPLPCFVENTPDLIPIFFADPTEKRSILALLNISFDWAVNSRIRFNPQISIKEVKELDEQGNTTGYSELGPFRQGGYQYLQLSSETAVPPMQMTILLLKH